MVSTIFFTPGPAALYPTVQNHVNEAFVNNIGSISHRGKAFQNIYEETDKQLRKLLGIPSDFKILFTGSATEIWERIIQSTVTKKSAHFVNGSFSSKFYDFSKELGFEAQKFEVPFGEGFYVDNYEIDQDAELICVTHNETSAGVVTPVAEINKLRAQYPNALIAVDAVSSVPNPEFDFSKIDSVFFSVQKGMGLPAGLGVWVVNERVISKAKDKLNQGGIIGTYHSVLSLVKNAEKFETPSTPNVLAIYLLGKVVADMNEKTVETIRKETNEKITLLYEFAAKSSILEPFVKDPYHQSPTVFVATVKGVEPSELISKLKENGLTIGSGYGNFKSSQIRIANFPATSVENIKLLISTLEKFYA